MNNEPVAWGYKDFNGDISDCICPEEHDRAEGDYTIPLYTHPAKTIWCACGDAITPDSGAVCGNCACNHPAKTLTDEEIEEVEKSCKKPLASWAWQVEFARAILRKAQEKC